MRIYYYPACGTCKKALKWLDENKIGYEKKTYCGSKSYCKGS